MKAEYIDHMGDDLRVVNAARVSFNKESKWIEENCPCGSYNPNICDGSCTLPQETLAEKDARLIQYLASHDHWTPFAHCSVTIRETIPIFIARQRFKHTVGFVYNEVSRRYVDDEPEFYTPSAWRKRAENAKQGSSDEEIKRIRFTNEIGESWVSDVNNLYFLALNGCVSLYKSLIEEGVAPEQARMVLPQSMYTSYYVTGSLVAWARMYQQRTKDNAQKEWNELTPQIDSIIRPIFPHAWSALVD